MSSGLLVSAASSAALDAEAHAEWGFNPFALIEAAGRNCARVFSEVYPDFFPDRAARLKQRRGDFRPAITVLAGSGNNGADAMVMLRYWILEGFIEPSASALIVNRMPGGGDTGPRAELVKSLVKMKVPVFSWEDSGKPSGGAPDRGAGVPGDSPPIKSDCRLSPILARSDIIVDGIAGTGIRGSLSGSAREMVDALNALINDPAASGPDERPLIVSVDIPSGNSDEWKPGMPLVRSDITLAIEPRKYCLYTPAARPYAGNILPVGGVFPGELTVRYGYDRIELLDWERARLTIPGIRRDAYKNERGTVEIHAGSPGASGAALIAARGAQAAGAGLVRLFVDDGIYPALASRAAGIMIAPEGNSALFRNGLSGGDSPGRFKPDAVLLGPGWGVKPERIPVLEEALILEKAGTPLVLDADAIELARSRIFNGNVILTPHPGEFSKYTGIHRDELLCHPIPALRKFAEERRAIIIFKGHVITVAAPDGRLGILDGMVPGLASGGSGDLLAGFCAAIAARMRRENRNFDLYDCAVAAAALLLESGRSGEIKNRFTDPLEIASKAAEIAGEAWLPQGEIKEGFYE